MATEITKTKKLLVALIAAAMASAALAGCGGSASTSNTSNTSNANDAATVNGNGNAADEDGQNPVMNFVGKYACDRANILVQAQGSDEALFTINWGSSAKTNSVWTMSGKFDEDTLTVEYSDGIRTDFSYTEGGEIDDEEDVYTTGTGKFTFSDSGDKLTVKWQDDNEHMADDMTFEYMTLS